MSQYYVSATGSDSANGTSTGTPWQTIGKVNTVGLLAGDSVSFKGGDAFAGNLLVNPATPPANEGQRIRVTNYGTGQATIQPGTGGAGVEVRDCGYVTVDVIIAGPGISLAGSYPTLVATTTSTAAGVLWYNTSSTVARTNLIVNNCTISGCLSGVALLSAFLKPTTAFDTFSITNNTIFNCGIYGIGMLAFTSLTAILALFLKETGPAVRKTSA